MYALIADIIKSARCIEKNGTHLKVCFEKGFLRKMPFEQMIYCPEFL
jgi:hypothetical protein